jgi:multiple sugar transport system substrate-binding protein
MTGLERLVHIPPRSHHVLRRYLTPFYGFVLGLAIILVLSACGMHAHNSPASITPTLAGNPSQTSSPAQFGTQAHTKSSPTPLPAIPATPNERTPSPLGVDPNELRGLQVTIWYPWTGASGASFQAIIDKFNQSNKWGIIVMAKGYEGFGSLDETVEAAIGSNSLPEVLVDYSSQARQWNERSVLVDLAPYVNDPVWGFTSDEQADFYPGFWSDDLVTAGIIPTSKRLGIPFYRSAYMLFYNQSWAEELGYLNSPASPEDFREQGCAAAEYVAKNGDKSNLGKGGWLISPEPDVLMGWIYAFGGSIIKPDDSGYAFNTPETRQALTYLKGLQESGCAWADASQDPQTAFANRRALFVVGSLFDIPAQQAAFAQLGSTDEWVVIPFPSDSRRVVESYGPSLLMTNSTVEKQLASWLVIEWLVYPPNQAEFVNQVEAYPSRYTTLTYLSSIENSRAQWGQALKLLPDARSEPTLATWEIMRWALSDASAQLFSMKFSAEQVPSLVISLDSLGQEILNQVH